jgi:ATP-dependent helicase HrpB
MLLFLPGVGEIQRVQERLAERVASDVILCPLYGALPLSEQRKAILPAPAGMRKVVLATNIAETSLTIEGFGWWWIAPRSASPALTPAPG